MSGDYLIERLRKVSHPGCEAPPCSPRLPSLTLCFLLCWCRNVWRLALILRPAFVIFSFTTVPWEIPCSSLPPPCHLVPFAVPRHAKTTKSVAVSTNSIERPGPSSKTKAWSDCINLVNLSPSSLMNSLPLSLSGDLNFSDEIPLQGQSSGAYSLSLLSSALTAPSLPEIFQNLLLQHCTALCFFNDDHLNSKACSYLQTRHLPLALEVIIEAVCFQSKGPQRSLPLALQNFIAHTTMMF